MPIAAQKLVPLFPSGKMKVEKGPSGSKNVVTLTAQDLQSHLWEAANILRGSAAICRRRHRPPTGNRFSGLGRSPA